jgi:hypothetical protein
MAVKLSKSEDLESRWEDLAAMPLSELPRHVSIPVELVAGATRLHLRLLTGSIETHGGDRIVFAGSTLCNRVSRELVATPHPVTECMGCRCAAAPYLTEKL